MQMIVMKFRLEKQLKKTGLYYYYRTDYRVNGKQKTDRVYLGKQEIAEQILEDFVSKKPDENVLIEYSGPMLLFSIAKKLKFQEIIETKVENNTKYSLGDLLILTIITRALHPKSKYKLATNYFSRSILPDKLNITDFEYNEDNIYNYMDHIYPYLHSIQASLVKAIIKNFNINISELILDGTSYSCHGRDEKPEEEEEQESDSDEIVTDGNTVSELFKEKNENEGKAPVGRFNGYSREKRNDLPQINFMLGVNNDYIPLFFETYTGNTADVTMFSHTLDKLEKEYKFLLNNFRSKYMLFDRGNWNKDNSDKINNLCSQYNFYYVAGMRMAHAESKATNWVPTEDQIIREDDETKIFGFVVDKKVYKKPVRVLIYYHPGIAKKKLLKLEEKITKVTKAIKNLQKPSKTEKIDLYTKIKGIFKKYRASWLFKVEKPKNKYITKINWHPNTESIDKRKKLAGKFALVTNRLDLSAQEIYRLYCTETVVERSFHLSRHLFDASTIFHSR